MVTKLWAYLIATALVITLIGAQAYHIHNLQHDLEIAGLNLDAATKANEGFVKSTSALVAANESEQSTRKALSARLEAEVGKRQQIEAIAASASKAMKNAERARNQAVAQLRSERETIYANNPAVAAWGAALVPGPISSQLRKRWNETIDRAHRGVEAGARPGNQTPVRPSPPRLGRPDSTEAIAGAYLQPWQLPAWLLYKQASQRGV